MPQYPLTYAIPGPASFLKCEPHRVRLAKSAAKLLSRKTDIHKIRRLARVQGEAWAFEK